MPQFVDPAVSKRKFNQQLAQWDRVRDDVLRRGWFLTSAEFPEVFIVFANPKLKPAALVFGALIDFSNYDFEPPSVKLVDPFTRQPYTAAQLPIRLNRAIPAANPGAGFEIQSLLQAYSFSDIPFLCIPGVREYHKHPGHTGDSWLLHRTSAEGTLYFIAEQLYKYGVEPINGYETSLRINISGFSQGNIPQ